MKKEQRKLLDSIQATFSEAIYDTTEAHIKSMAAAGDEGGEGVRIATLVNIHISMMKTLMAVGTANIANLRSVILASTEDEDGADEVAARVVSDAYTAFQGKILPTLLGEKVCRQVAARMVKQQDIDEKIAKVRKAFESPGLATNSGAKFSDILASMRKQ